MINKILDKQELQLARPLYEVIIKKDNEVIYQNKAYAGAVSLVEKVTEINKDFEVPGRTQKLMFGHPVIIFFAFDQLRSAFQKKLGQMVDFVKDTYSKMPDGMERLIKIGLLANIKDE